MFLIHNQMRQAGHLTWIEDARLPKQLQRGKHPIHKHKKRFKNVKKKRLKAPCVDVQSRWQKIDQFEKVVSDGCKAFKMQTKEHSNVDSGNRTRPRSRIPFYLDMFVTSAVWFLCLNSDLQITWDLMIMHKLFLQKYNDYLCEFYGQVYGSVTGLRSHMRVHIWQSLHELSFSEGSRECYVLSLRNWRWLVGWLCLTAYQPL